MILLTKILFFHSKNFKKNEKISIDKMIVNMNMSGCIHVSVIYLFGYENRIMKGKILKENMNKNHFHDVVCCR